MEKQRILWPQNSLLLVLSSSRKRRREGFGHGLPGTTPSFIYLLLKLLDSTCSEMGVSNSGWSKYM